MSKTVSTALTLLPEDKCPHICAEWSHQLHNAFFMYCTILFCYATVLHAHVLINEAERSTSIFLVNAIGQDIIKTPFDRIYVSPSTVEQGSGTEGMITPVDNCCGNLA